MRLREAFALTKLADVVSFEVFREHCPTAHVVLKPQGAIAFDDSQRSSGFSFLVSGRVKLVKTRDCGGETILDFVQLGSSLCPVKPHEGAEYCCRAVAADHATRLLLLNRDEALALVSAVPEVMSVFVRMVGDRAANMCARAGELSAGSVGRRIAALLLRLSDSGERRDSAIRIEQPLSRRDLAEMSGTRPETAVRCMRALEKAGVVRTHAWGFEVLDLARLKAAVAE